MTPVMQQLFTNTQVFFRSEFELKFVNIVKPVRSVVTPGRTFLIYHLQLATINIHKKWVVSILITFLAGYLKIFLPITY